MILIVFLCSCHSRSVESIDFSRIEQVAYLYDHEVLEANAQSVEETLKQLRKAQFTERTDISEEMLENLIQLRPLPVTLQVTVDGREYELSWFESWPYEMNIVDREAQKVYTGQWDFSPQAVIYGGVPGIYEKLLDGKELVPNVTSGTDRADGIIYHTWQDMADGCQAVVTAELKQAGSTIATVTGEIFTVTEVLKNETGEELNELSLFQYGGENEGAVSPGCDGAVIMEEGKEYLLFLDDWIDGSLQLCNQKYAYAQVYEDAVYALDLSEPSSIDRVPLETVREYLSGGEK